MSPPDPISTKIKISSVYLKLLNNLDTEANYEFIKQNERDSTFDYDTKFHVFSMVERNSNKGEEEWHLIISRKGFPQIWFESWINKKKLSELLPELDSNNVKEVIAALAESFVHNSVKINGIVPNKSKTSTKGVTLQLTHKTKILRIFPFLPFSPIPSTSNHLYNFFLTTESSRKKELERFNELMKLHEGLKIKLKTTEEELGRMKDEVVRVGGNLVPIIVKNGSPRKRRHPELGSIQRKKTPDIQVQADEEGFLIDGD